MSARAIVDPPGVATPAGYSHAVVTQGPLVHVAGQVALDADGTTVAVRDFAGQVEQALANLDRVLAAAGSAFGDIASLTILCVASVDRERLVALREPLRRRYAPNRPPAITVVFVAGLLREEWLVEVQAVAAVPATSGGDDSFVGMPPSTASGTAA